MFVPSNKAYNDGSTFWFLFLCRFNTVEDVANQLMSVRICLFILKIIVYNNIWQVSDEQLLTMKVFLWLFKIMLDKRVKYILQCKSQMAIPEYNWATNIFVSNKKWIKEICSSR